MSLHAVLAVLDPSAQQAIVHADEQGDAFAGARVQPGREAPPAAVLTGLA